VGVGAAEGRGQAVPPRANSARAWSQKKRAQDAAPSGKKRSGGASHTPANPCNGMSSPRSMHPAQGRRRGWGPHSGGDWKKGTLRRQLCILIFYLLSLPPLHKGSPAAPVATARAARTKAAKRMGVSGRGGCGFGRGGCGWEGARGEERLGGRCEEERAGSLFFLAPHPTSWTPPPLPSPAACLPAWRTCSTDVLECMCLHFLPPCLLCRLRWRRTGRWRRCSSQGLPAAGRTGLGRRTVPPGGGDGDPLGRPPAGG